MGSDLWTSAELGSMATGTNTSPTRRHEYFWKIITWHSGYDTSTTRVQYLKWSVYAS